MAQNSVLSNWGPFLVELENMRAAESSRGSRESDISAVTATEAESSRPGNSPPMSQITSTLASELEALEKAGKRQARNQRSWVRRVIASVRSTMDASVASAAKGATDTLGYFKGQCIGAAVQTKWALRHPKKAVKSAYSTALDCMSYAEQQAVKKLRDVQTVGLGYVGKVLATTADVVKKTNVSARGMLGQVKQSGRYVTDNAKWACQNPRAVASSAATKVAENGAYARSVASDKTVQATAASAAGGAVALGTSSAATGLLGGATIGAVVGLPAAFFTFGLSIPAGAILGGSAGMCTGAAVGGGVGLVGGGAAGYGAYTKKDDIKSSTAGAWANLRKGAGNAKEKARESAKSLRKRIAGSTGGTA